MAGAVVVDAWNPETYCSELRETLEKQSQLILDYHVEGERLMTEHLNSSPYQSLKPNQYTAAHQEFKEYVLAPVLAKSRIRVWHYTRLTEHEVGGMKKRLRLSSLDDLRARLNLLVENKLLSSGDANIIYEQSPLHRQQSVRAGRLWTTITPQSYANSGVVLLLESWGGESAYFWMRDQRIASALKGIGSPRIVEIETSLTDKLNGYMVAETVLTTWAKHLGVPVVPAGCDLAITGAIDSARVVQIHTKGEEVFKQVGVSYPEGINRNLGGE